MNWIDYIAHYTTPRQPLAIVPKAPQAASPVIMAAIRLPDVISYRDGILDIRMRWTHHAYTYVETKGDWILLRAYFGGNIGRRREDVLFEHEMIADYKATVLSVA